MRFTKLVVCATAAAVFGLSAPPAIAQLDQTVNEAESATDAARASQRRIDSIQDETGDLFRQYRAALQQIDSQELFVDQQEVFLRSQENELADLELQIGEVDIITRSLYPMQQEMIDRLEEFINLDLPFLQEDRRARVAGLRAIMVDHNIPPAERYRKIIEAYQIETDYGRFLRHYEGPLGEGANAPTVDYLLIGRVAYIYMTKDESDLGIWDAAAGAWSLLPGSYRTDVRQAIRMAKEVTTPNVFLAPVPGPTSAAEG